MTSTIKSVEELVSQDPHVDNRNLFDDLWGILSEHKAQIDGQFQLMPDPSTKDLQPFAAPGGKAKGYLSTFVGDEVDWLVHSWMGNPEKTFSNMHLAAWLGPSIQVPHLGMALGTMPDIFMYLDFIPRRDLRHDLEYHDRYYEPVNPIYLDMLGDPAVKPFVSKSLFMRTAQSHTSLCFMIKPSVAMVEKIKRVSRQLVGLWLSYVEEAREKNELVPESQRVALAERDLLLRRTIAERDPANSMGEHLFGESLTNKLVGSLWGQDRQIPRVGSV